MSDRMKCLLSSILRRKPSEATPKKRETFTSLIYCGFLKLTDSRAATGILCFCILSLNIQYKQ